MPICQNFRVHLVVDQVKIAGAHPTQIVVRQLRGRNAQANPVVKHRVAQNLDISPTGMRKLEVAVPGSVFATVSCRRDKIDQGNLADRAKLRQRRLVT